MRPLYFIVLFFVGLLYSVKAQDVQRKGDSLLAVYHKAQTNEKKIEILHEVIDVYLYNDADKTKKYVFLMDSLASGANNPKGRLTADFNLGYYYFNKQQMDSAEIYFNKTLKASKTIQDSSFVSSTLQNMSIIKAHNGAYKEAIRLMDSVAAINLRAGDYLDYASALVDTGVHYFEMGNYPKAMTLYKRGLEIYDSLETKTYLRADLYRNIGKLHSMQNNVGKAVDFFDLAIKEYRRLEDNLFLANTLTDLGNAYSANKKRRAAIDSYNESLRIAKANNFEYPEIIAYGNIGSEQLLLKNYRSAFDYLQKAVATGKGVSANNNFIRDMSHLGYVSVMLEKNEEGYRLLDRAIGQAKDIGVLHELQNALYYKGMALKYNGEYMEAIASLQESRIISDSLLSLEKAKHINELQTLYETEKKEAAIALQEEEIEALNQRIKIDRLTKGLYAGGLFTFMAVSGLLFFGFTQRMKKNRIAREKQEEIYKQEIEHKKKELASQTLHLVQKNTFIQELMENLENIKNSPEKFKMEFRRIVMLLKKENASDKDWEVFKTYFADVHNDFDQKLKTLNGNISDKELRLASFLRMKLSTKEIAATINVLPESILTSKYRLKKKLGLSKEVDLTDFLNSL
ncbi:tetratricopeptide repeat protein [Maribacter chungangensis]|uniref:Tetratricopeptide repeat protein n=1 Tax=Maribacter chungangensis TaxID=1069117 RepID=A0ABW3B2M8_9FLAO